MSESTYDAHEASELIIKYLQDELSEEEKIRLLAWRSSSPEFEALFLEFTDKYKVLEDLKTQEGSKKKGLAYLIALFPELQSRVIKLSLKHISVAALILVAAGGAYFLVGRNTPPGVVQNSVPAPPHDIVAPTGTRTILTLGNGQQITIDSVGNGLLAEQGAAKISKLSNGQIAYTAVNEKPPKILYNTLSTGRGGQTALTLSDGTHVWLDASSSIRFPSAFAGNMRNVEITGQAYFDIASNKSVPFIVKVKDASIKVLGTQFNVMAYDNEGAIQTTLLQGAVMVARNGKGQVLHPGQQAKLVVSGPITLSNDVDTAAVVSWKNGQFQFDAADIHAIMKQLQRWYDIDVEYEGNPDIQLSGAMSRNVNLNSVLKLMENNGAHFRLDGRKVTVLK